jgi:predicted GNAT family N-acyltransferase
MGRLTGSPTGRTMRHKPFRIEDASWRKDRAELELVRRQVFINEQEIPESEEWDDVDENSSHVLVYSEKRDVVGTGRIEPNGKIARLAVLAEYRGQGVGSAILARLLEEARKKGFSQVYLHAQTRALDFYKKFGFVSDKEIFSEGGIPHVIARLDL